MAPVPAQGSPRPQGACHQQPQRLGHCGTSGSVRGHCLGAGPRRKCQVFMLLTPTPNCTWHGAQKVIAHCRTEPVYRQHPAIATEVGSHTGRELSGLTHHGF